VIAHRPSALAGVDQVLVMDEGRMQSFGPKDEVLSKVLRPVPAPQAAEPRAASAAPLKVVQNQGV
jgi:ATP-binding cassette subfamily C protein